MSWSSSSSLTGREERRLDDREGPTTRRWPTPKPATGDTAHGDGRRESDSDSSSHGDDLETIVARMCVCVCYGWHSGGVASRRLICIMEACSWCAAAVMTTGKRCNLKVF